MKKKLKINFIISGIFRAGGMRVIFEYGNRLKAKGHDVILYFPFKSYDFYKGQSSLYFRLKNHYWRIKELMNYKKVMRTIYPYDFVIKGVPVINEMFVRDADAVIATQWPTAFSIDKLSASKGKKLYLIQGYEAWNSNVELADKSYQLPLTRITISKYLKNLLIEKFDEDSKVIYNGIDFSNFQSNNKDFNKKRKKILFIDHYLEIKGIDVIIQVVSKIKDRYNNVDFTCFGYQKYHDFPEYVEFVKNPSDKEINRLYSEADIFLFASVQEGFGLPPAEAMACKCAVVSTNVGAIPEYSVNKETAILTNPDNPDELYKGICYLFDNESELKRISLAGYEKVREFFDWNQSVDMFEKFISEKSL